MLPTLHTSLSAIAALLVVLALIWLATSGARLAGFTPRPASGRTLRITDAVALDSRRRLHLVSCGDRQVLLLTGGGSDVVVGWLPAASARASDRPEDQS